MNWQDCWIGLDQNGPTIQVKGTVLAVAEAKGVPVRALGVAFTVLLALVVTMAATGLLYLAILTAAGTDLVARALLA